MQDFREKTELLPDPYDYPANAVITVNNEKFICVAEWREGELFQTWVPCD